jgi:rhodanese-related sulfurtransferase
MAWNAAKRAKEWGYNNVWWFREGVDGWLDNGWQLQNSVPINLPVND